MYSEKLQTETCRMFGFIHTTFYRLNKGCDKSFWRIDSNEYIQKTYVTIVTFYFTGETYVCSNKTNIPSLMDIVVNT